MDTKLDELIEFRSLRPPVKPFPSLLQSSENTRRVELNKLSLKKKPKKVFQPGMVPGDAPGSTAELSTKLDALLFDTPQRNQYGQFTNQTEGVADPNSMAKTYAQPAAKVAGGAKVGGALLAGGALGAIGGAAGKDAYGAVKNLLAKHARRPKV